MQQYFTVLQNMPIFTGITSDLPKLFSCLGAKVHTYSRNTVVFYGGDRVNRIGIVLKGSVKLLKEDAEGHAVLLAALGVGHLFGEALAFADTAISPVTVVAEDESDILFLEVQHILTVCETSCKFHQVLLTNMLRLMAQKNVYLNQRVELLSKRTIREKLTLYLQQQQTLHNARQFTVPFDRADLADFLCVDRSALSRELCHMRDEGYLTFTKNQFTLL